MFFQNGETVTVIRAGVKVDPYSGEPIGEDWDNATEQEYSDVAVSHGPSSEDWLAGRNPVDIALTLYMPYDADVTTTDRVHVRNETYAVYGEPFQWRSPFTGAELGTEVILKRVDG